MSFAGGMSAPRGAYYGVSCHGTYVPNPQQFFGQYQPATPVDPSDWTSYNASRRGGTMHTDDSFGFGSSYPVRGSGRLNGPSWEEHRRRAQADSARGREESRRRQEQQRRQQERRRYEQREREQQRQQQAPDTVCDSLAKLNSFAARGHGKFVDCTGLQSKKCNKRVAMSFHSDRPLRDQASLSERDIRRLRDERDVLYKSYNQSYKNDIEERGKEESVWPCGAN